MLSTSHPSCILGGGDFHPPAHHGEICREIMKIHIHLATAVALAALQLLAPAQAAWAGEAAGATMGPSSVLPASLYGVAAACGILSGKCGEGSCVGNSYCTGGGCATPVCYSPKSLASQVMCQGASLPAACMGGATRAMWVWQPSSVTNACARTRLFQFALARHIDTLYVQAASLLDNPAQHATLAAFIALADGHGLKVELLAGSPTWSLTSGTGLPATDGHARALQVAAEAVAFVAALPNTAPKPTALHYDVEPHQLWTAATLNATATAYLTMLGSVQAQLAGSGLAFHADIPFHYDNKLVTIGAVTRPLHEWVIDIIDGVVVMDYRDTTAQIVGQGQTQVQYAAAVGKPVVVGLMLTSSTPTYTTFFEEGPTVMETAMALTSFALDASPATQPGWTGFAVENYSGYVASMQQFWPAAMAQWLPCGPLAAVVSKVP